MIVGVNALFRASGGSLASLRQLLREWSASGALDTHRVVVFASASSEAALRDALPPEVVAKLVIEVDHNADRGLPARLWSEQVVLPRRLRVHGIDVLYCPANVVPWVAGVPTVVVFQNAAPFCESVTFGSLRSVRWWVRFRVLRLFVRASAARATRVVFLSRWFRERFVGRFGLPPERGVVVPHPVPDARGWTADPALERALGIERPYVLYVSHLNPYKNVLEVIDAFAQVQAGRGPVQLVLAGMSNFPRYRAAIERRIVECGLQGRVVLAGLVDSASVGSLLAGCEVFVFASTCENCPIALLEAFAAGAAVASSNRGVMPEVTGDAVLPFDPDEPAQIAEALRRLLSDAGLRDAMRRRSRERAASWPGEAEVAASTLRILEDAARGALQ